MRTRNPPAYASAKDAARARQGSRSRSPAQLVVSGRRYTLYRIIFPICVAIKSGPDRSSRSLDGTREEFEIVATPPQDLRKLGLGRRVRDRIEYPSGSRTL